MASPNRQGDFADPVWSHHQVGMAASPRPHSHATVRVPGCWRLVMAILPTPSWRCHRPCPPKSPSTRTRFTEHPHPIHRARPAASPSGLGDVPRGFGDAGARVRRYGGEAPVGRFDLRQGPSIGKAIVVKELAAAIRCALHRVTVDRDRFTGVQASIIDRPKLPTAFRRRLPPGLGALAGAFPLWQRGSGDRGISVTTRPTRWAPAHDDTNPSDGRRASAGRRARRLRSRRPNASRFRECEGMNLRQTQSPIRVAKSNPSWQFARDWSLFLPKDLTDRFVLACQTSIFQAHDFVLVSCIVEDSQ